MTEAHLLDDRASPPAAAPADHHDKMAAGHAVASPEQDWAWVPIRALAARHRHRIAAHLMDLDARDRYLRFGQPATDEQILRYVESIDFANDAVFGVFNRRLDLIAMAHLAHPKTLSDEKAQGRMAEFGVSVSQKARGRGFGHRLFERSVLRARNRGVKRLLVHALSENTAMLRIARAAGATVQREGSEAQGWLSLPPDNLASQIGEMVERQAAELDYSLKRHAKRFTALLDIIHEVRAHTSRSGHMAEE